MLDATHIAIYGADITEEGAVLLLFDLKFGMNVAVRRLKFFCDPPHLYCLPANNVLMLCVVQNLVVVPYILQPSLLWNLIDSTQLPGIEVKKYLSLVEKELIVNYPETKTKPAVIAWHEEPSEIPTAGRSLNFRNEDVNKLAASLLDLNASNCRLFDELLPALKEQQDVDGMRLLLSSVKDLPEKWLADLLNFAMERGERAELLEVLLTVPYSDVVLLNHLRRKLTTKSTITFLQHLSERLEKCQLSRDDHVSSSQPNIGQLVDWISLVLDAHHHELLIAGSDKQVKQLIEKLGQQVTESVRFIKFLSMNFGLVIVSFSVRISGLPGSVGAFY